VDSIDYTRPIWLADNAMQDKVTRSCLYGLSYIENASKRKNYNVFYSETYLNLIFLGPTFVSGIDSCLFYTG
jgi:hypothetical protein